VRRAEEISFVLSAKGAALNLEPGATPKAFGAESAIQLWRSAKAEMKRAFSACIRADKFPWGDAPGFK
jgi:hypothetical protein